MAFYISVDILNIPYYDVFRIIFCKIVCTIFLSYFPCNEIFLKCFWVTNPKIAHIHCVWLLLLDCIILNSIGCLIVHANFCNVTWVDHSSNVFRRMTTSLLVTKNPPVSASASEATTNFKILQFTCIGPLSHPCAHFEGIIPRENILQRERVLQVKLDMTHQCWRVKSCLKREIWPLHLDMLKCNPKTGVPFSHLFLWGHFLL